MYVTMALEYERKCTLLCMLDQTRKTPLLSQHHDEGTPICIAALENYPYLAYLQKKSGCATPILHHPLTATFGLVKAHCPGGWAGAGTKTGEPNCAAHSRTCASGAGTLCGGVMIQ